MTSEPSAEDKMRRGWGCIFAVAGTTIVVALMLGWLIARIVT